MSKENIIQLEKIPISDLEQWISDYIITKLKLLLMIDYNEYLPRTQNYFELGLSSLQLQEFKQEIECSLDKTVNLEVFFNNPTINDLVAHLKNVTLKDYFDNKVTKNEKLSQEESSKIDFQAPIINNLDNYEFDEQDILDRALNSLGIENY